MLEISYIKDKIKTIRKAQGKPLSFLVSNPMVVIDATQSTKLLKKHIRDHLNSIGQREKVETKIKKFLSLSLKGCTLITDDLAGAGQYYPSFLMAKEPRGHYTTIALLVSGDTYRFIPSNSGITGTFDYAPDTQISYENYGLVHSNTVRIEQLNKGLKFLAPEEKKRTYNYGLKLHSFKVPEVDNTLYMGVELEVGRKKTSPLEIAKTTLSDLNPDFFKDENRGRHNYTFGMIKKDGSIPNHGFEIVSAPATLKYHHIAWDKFFTNSAKHLRSFTLASCGMHIHVSRQAFKDNGTTLKDSSGHLGRFNTFYNMPENGQFITNIAGRSTNSFTQYHPKKVTAIFTNQNVGDRYQAVNLTNKHTVEVRIFKGNCKREGFLKNIDFVHASYEFTRNAGYGITRVNDMNNQAFNCKNLSYVNFILWVQQPENIATYPYLTRWLQARKLIDTKLIKLNEEYNPKDKRTIQPLTSDYLSDVA